MADIINFNSAKKENSIDKLKFLNDLLVQEHKCVLKHIKNMLIYEKTVMDDNSNKDYFIYEINGGTLSTCKIKAAKNKSKYEINIIDYDKRKYGIETVITFDRTSGTFIETTKKRKRVLDGGKFIECKFTKSTYELNGKLIGRITYLRDENETVLFQENQLTDEKRLVNIYGYDEKLNLVTMLRGFKKDVGYLFFDGYTNNLRVPEDKALFALGLKDIITRKTKYAVRPARLSKLDVITKDELDLMNNRKKVEDAIKSIPKLSDKYFESLDKFDGYKKYMNEFDEEVTIIRLNDGNIYTFTKKNAPIFDVQAEKYKCFYENDFLNPNNIVSEVELLTYPLVNIDELVITKIDREENTLVRKSIETYDDDYLLLKRIKDDVEGLGEYANVIKKSEYILETNDNYKKQIFDKKFYAFEGYDEYTYICNPEENKVGFKFVTREYYDESIREVFAFGKLNPNNTFKTINSIFARKNSLLDAMILKSEDAEDMNPDRVLMDFGKVATSDIQLKGMEYFDYRVDRDDPSTHIYVDANRLTKFLNDFDYIQEKMLKKYNDYNHKAKNIVAELLKNDAILEAYKNKFGQKNKKQ